MEENIQISDLIDTEVISSANINMGVIHVSKNGNDTRGELSKYNASQPFLTIPAAQSVAESGDTIIVSPGDYSSAFPLSGADGVTFEFMNGTIVPNFSVTDEFTFTIIGDIASILVNNASANIEVKGNIKSLDCLDGNIKARDVGGSVDVTGGNAYITNYENVALCYGGTLTIDGADVISSTVQPVRVDNGGNLIIKNSRIECTNTNDMVVAVFPSATGSLRISNTSLIMTNVGTNGKNRGILFTTSIPTQLKDVTIITAQDGSGVASSVDSSNAHTIYVQGSLNQTHAVDGDITVVGGSAITNTGFTA